MKKNLISLLFTLLLFSCIQQKKVFVTKINPEKIKNVVYDFKGKVDVEVLTFLAKNYNWNTQEILIVNYSQPIKDCHFDNNQLTKQSIKFFDDFYAKINTENSLIVKVFSNGERIRRKLDNVKYFDDKEDFLYINFFSKKRSCFGVLVIHKNGNYYQYNGHYTEKQVAKFSYNLKKEYN